MTFIRTALLFLMCFAREVFTECSEGCQSCLSTTCLSCELSYFLSDGFCSKCPKDCNSCNDFDDCTSCKPNKHGLHAKCAFDCASNCLNGECQDDTGDCTQCKSGLYGFQCQHNCTFCEDESCNLRSCSHGCRDGYYQFLNKNETFCQSCPSECRHCKDGKTCQECNDGFHLYQSNDNIHCILCLPGSQCLDYCVIQGCNECQIRNKFLTCIDCPEGQSFNGLACETNASPCSKECSTYCDSNGTCHGECNDGWTGSKCADKCIDTCLKCSKENGKACLQCKGDYYSSDCSLNCSSGCMIVKGNITCKQSEGYCLNGCKQKFWGEICNKTCLSVCKDSTCDRNTGKCKVDCEDNGQECTTSTPISQSVSSTSKNASSTTPKSGDKKEVKQDNDTSDITIIAAAAGGGFLVLILIIVIGVCLLKRRRKLGNTDTADNAHNEAVFANADTAHTAHNESIATEDGAVYAKPNKKADGLQESLDYIYAQPDKSHKQKKASKKEISLPKSMYNNIAIDLNDVEEAPEDGYATVAVGRESVRETEETDVDEIKLEDLDDGNSKLIDTEVEPPSADLYYNTASLIRSRIQLSDFLEYTKNKTDFESEFEKLPKGLTRPCDIALMRKNRIKNRYNGVYAYDATRVPLQNKSYINANYIDGHKKSPEYIASLGPTKTAMNNFKDFWEMVWLERTDKIIMLTNLEESGKMKCEQYWPDQGKTKIYQGYKVVGIAETIYSEFTIREFHVSEKGSEPRTVVQYHYTAWPDRSVPDNVASLVEFRNKVEQRKSQDAGPVVVHCSAGIGRTGTYIALDTLIQESKDENYIDIFGRVMGLRGQRGHMVQNLEQYIFLHQCLLYAVTCDPYPLPVTDIPRIMTDEKISQQFQTFSDVVIPKGFDRKSSANPKTRKENRKGADIPGDQYRVKLCSTKHDYINAVYVHGYKSRNKFIVAQTPLPNTVEDFISMLYHEQRACVVDLDDDNTKDKTIGHYLPVEGKVTTKVGHFQVACQKSETLKHAIVRSLMISSTGLKLSHEVHVKHYQYKCWTQSEKVPSSVESFLELVRDAENVVREQKLERPIIVHCLTGAERSCLFCAVSIIVEKCSLEKEISVLNTICQLRSRRKTAFSDITTVRFCYDCCKSIGTNADRKQYYNMVKLL